MTTQELTSLEASAVELASKMPELLISARNVSHSMTYGLHGRKKAGPGDTFWQFRKYDNGDSFNQIDWRKSANSSTLFVREKEWEAAHTIWLWPELSPSMMFQSHIADTTKRERALILMFALCNLLIQSGERVGILGLSDPMTHHRTSEKMAQIISIALAKNPEWPDMPPEIPVSTLSECIILSDCLVEQNKLMERYKKITSNGAKGHIIQILDPAEETFPYRGRTEFHSYHEDTNILIDRADDIKTEYKTQLQNLKESLKQQLAFLNWSFLTHHTDQNTTIPLLAVYQRISASFEGLYNSSYTTQSSEVLNSKRKSGEPKW